METQNIAPVDLNSFVCYNMDILSYLYEVSDLEEGPKKAVEYQQMFNDFRHTHEKVFYNNTEGAWYDYNTRTSKHTLVLYPSHATPLFTGCYNRLDQSKSERLFKKFEEEKYFDYPGGIPSSMVAGTNQQW